MSDIIQTAASQLVTRSTRHSPKSYDELGRLKTRDWKTRDWKSRHQTAGVENAGVAQYGKPKSPLFNIVTSVLQQPLELM